MTTERDSRTPIVLSWLREDGHENAERVLLRILDEVDTTPQRRPWWPPRRFAQMNRLVLAATTAAAVLVVAVVGYNLLAPDVAVGPSPGPSQTAPRSTSAASASTLPDLPMPGARANQVAGDYGWTGSLGSRTGMHSVSEVGMTQLVFAVENDCFARGTAVEPVPVTVAGLDGTYAEPYEDPQVLFMPEPAAGQTTGAYALGIGDRTLCVYLTWDATTTRAELDAARQVVESIRGQPFGETGIRITFTLQPGWDTG